MATGNRALQIMRQLPGSWRLPITKKESVTITFQANGHFYWVASANAPTKKALQIALGAERQGNWQVRSEPGSRGSLRGSSAAGRSSSANLMARLRSQPVPSGPPIPEGPYLILNFTELPKSALNLSLFGVRADVADWINNFLETVRDGNHRIVEFHDDRMVVELPSGSREAWHRADRGMPESES